ncbi:MAG: response regulator [Chloroflexota bacterium]
MAEGTLEDSGRKIAQRELHKLVGAIGSFGFTEGSRLARAAEQLLQSETIPSQECATQLEAIVGNLARELRQDARLLAREAIPKPKKPLVLLVDDDVNLCEILASEAEAQQLQVRHAASIRSARRLIGEHPPDLVLLDLGFEGGHADSLSLLSELAQRDPSVPVVVLTASTDLLDRVAVAERGAVAFLQKSLPPAQVIDAISQILKQDRTVEARVLVVDDDPLVLEVLQTLLAPHGYRVTTLSDPMRFWDVLEESPPDLLLLDVDMPEVTGIKLCRAVRTDMRWAGVPILFLSAHDDASTIQRVFAAGADDYLIKPIVVSELLIRVANRLERTQLHRRMAETDVLTGLATRQKASQLIAQLLRLSERHGKPVSLAVVDLDEFKAVNDRFGHSVGDRVLRRTADVLFQAFRRDDVVGRWGGEEFIVGLYGMSREGGQERLQRALRALQDERFESPGGEEFRVSFSAGVAEFPADGLDLPSLFRRADAALYLAKAAGRSQVLAAG